MIELVGFDGDDTLWHSQDYYDRAQAEFEAILGQYVDLANANLHDALLATERGNIALFGYGAKGMTLSMIESAIQVTEGRISAQDIHRIVKIGKDVLSHPVELLPGIRQAVEEVARDFRIVLITKGDLFHQEHKVARCGLADVFHRIEIVSEKDPAAYARLFREFDVQPSNFAMVGNSLRSDIAPVVALGGWGVFMPYHSTWAHETETDFAVNERVIEVTGAEGIPAAIATMHATSTID
ncbi:putative hydrolase of the HAD superfamily [Luteibacter sp. Sphag1AF]|uniref:HAD family hydrolase n=1 Tax=Luteibacter sp. Sphag1AF TaxID=2587031 RepID=UPI00160BB3A8|nr:HAD family hydrolase [Luteibacter sp. Sphag1AF]MBB3225995.1 putative hydrolase of the HAD superfamily [Luteibacter sp. Sphag1AF]